MKHIIITYDISNNKLRNKIAKELLRFGIRTQKSLFECFVNEKELKILKKIAKKYSKASDYVTIYELKGKIKRVGDTTYLEVDDLVF